MAKEYGRTSTVSIKIAIRRWWIFAWVLIAGSLLGGLTLLIALAFGAANPPVEDRLQAQFTHPDDWPLTRHTTDLGYYLAPAVLPSGGFTLQASAINTGPPDSAWGLWLAGETDVLVILLNNEGYLSVTRNDGRAWQGFPHSRPGQPNQIALTVTETNAASLRINDELAWSGIFTPVEGAQWGILYDHQPQMTGSSVLIFAR